MNKTHHNLAKCGPPFLFVIILLFSASGCAALSPGSPTGAPNVNLTVMAAASLLDSFNDLGAQFQASHPGVEVKFNFAGSQQLAQQIASGAPTDVFASANQAQMEVAVKTSRIDGKLAKIFAQNRLVVIFPKDNPARLARLQDLARPGLKLVFAAKEVPVGQYSLNFLQKASEDPAFSADFESDVLKNVVSYEDNVKAVLTKVALGEADAGIVYTTDAAADPGAEVGQLAIPDALNVIASYPIAALSDGSHLALAQAFVDFVLSAQGQATLQKYGFIPANN
jgi:molybdate transport system substrate-binding protein